MARLPHGDPGVGVAGVPDHPPRLQRQPGYAAVLRHLDAVGRRPVLGRPGQANAGGGLAGPQRRRAAGAGPRRYGGRVVDLVVVVVFGGVPGVAGRAGAGRFIGGVHVGAAAVYADLVVLRIADADGGGYLRALGGAGEQGQDGAIALPRNPPVFGALQVADGPGAGGGVV